MLKPLFPSPTPQMARPCAREAARTNLFVLAQLEAGGLSNEVRVRDISANGALLQGIALPRKGAQCVLVRGSIRLSGWVVWATGQRAGMRFDGQALVSEWISRGHGDSQPAPAGTALPPPAKDAAAPDPGPAVQEPLLDLQHLASALMRVEEELARDPAVKSKHQDSLRVLGAVCDHLAARIQSRGR